MDDLRTGLDSWFVGYFGYMLLSCKLLDMTLYLKSIRQLLLLQKVLENEIKNQKLCLILLSDLYLSLVPVSGFVLIVLILQYWLRNTIAPIVLIF